MCRFIFSLPFYVFSIALGVGLWFLIDYLEQFRLYSTLADLSVIFAMAAVFGIVFYVAIATIVIPLKGFFGCSKSCQNS
ncbi:hypothetical protein [Campylobacter gastrosuis]|uniref:Uncharacterized protein n=1 Tax=Campylobacter gastrosuis TaxID=2974576 RepID=A0ABT7HRJ8_9BACT|nr:hypothetical protein [Campylobacter gastrosuis]MDL0089542.1 hypothetical protein [Campylobacter gastrosuis]